MSAVTRSPSFTYDTAEAIARREKIVKSIGIENLGAFESWAFKAKTPMVYDRRILFIWQCAHATKTEIKDESDIDAAVDKMVLYWKQRFDLTEGMLWEMDE